MPLKLVLPRVLAAAICLVLTAGLDAGESDVRARADRLEARIMALGKIGGNENGGVNRMAFTTADLEGRAYVERLMNEAGLVPSVDLAGNLLGRRAGTEDLPPIMLGSHTDSVPNAGKYDGNVGVLGAIEVAQLLREHGIALRHPLEVVVFTDEEGGLTGSRAMAGQLGADGLGVPSLGGVRTDDGIRSLGGDPARLAEVVRKPGDLTAYLELHIEQGAVLDEAGLDIGVVTGIVGIKRWDVTITGFANHAGTTPMDKRRDALLSGAEFIQAVNRIVRMRPGNQVGTVGVITAEPGAANVIPGKVTLSLEIRDLSETVIDDLFRQIEAEAGVIAGQHDTPISFVNTLTDAHPALTDERIRGLIGDAAAELGLSAHIMPSGAGHDAQDLALVAPMGMIFVPSRAGISHAPGEFTAPQDMANGADVLLRTLLAVDRGALDAQAGK